MKKFFQDFKEFAMKGNIIDMAVGVVLGSAFKEIVTALVSNIINPIIGIFTGQGSLADLKYVITPAVIDAAGAEIVPENAITYGAFLQTIIDFLIIAFSIFVVIRIMMNTEKKLKELLCKKKEEEQAQEEAVSEEDEISVLKEIRDMLKENKAD